MTCPLTERHEVRSVDKLGAHGSAKGGGNRRSSHDTSISGANYCINTRRKTGSTGERHGNHIKLRKKIKVEWRKGLDFSVKGQEDTSNMA